MNINGTRTNANIISGGIRDGLKIDELTKKVDTLTKKTDDLAAKQDQTWQAVMEIQGELTDNSLNIKIIDNKVKAL